MAELVDALASGASGFTAVKVRVLSWAPRFAFGYAWRSRARRSPKGEDGLLRAISDVIVKQPWSVIARFNRAIQYSRNGRA